MIPTPTPAQANWKDRHVLYRIFDADDRLIYIGATYNLAERLRLHEAHTWWHELTARVETEEFPTRRAAFIAEALAIQEEQPAFNVRSAGRADGDFSHFTANDLAVCQRWHDNAGFLVSKMPMCLRDHLRAAGISTGVAA